MSYVTSWERFAREEGLAKGRQEGEAKALLRQLQAKFGPPTADLAARVQASEPDQIEVWLTRILTANSPDEVFEAR